MNMDYVSAFHMKGVVKHVGAEEGRGGRES